MHNIFSTTKKNTKNRILIAKAVDCPEEIDELVLQDLDAALAANGIEAYAISDYQKSIDTDLYYAVFDKPVSMAEYSVMKEKLQKAVAFVSDKVYPVTVSLSIFPFSNTSKVDGFYRYDLQVVDKKGGSYGNKLPANLIPFIGPYVEQAVEQEFDLPAKDCTFNLQTYGRDGYPLVIKSEKALLQSKVIAFLKSLKREFPNVPFKSNITFTMAM